MIESDEEVGVEAGVEGEGGVTAAGGTMETGGGMAPLEVSSLLQIIRFCDPLFSL